MMQNLILALLLPVAQMLFSAMTPALRELLSNFLRDLLSKAMATSSPWDDFLVKFLCGIVGVSTDGVVAAQPAPGVIPVTMPAAVSKAIMSANFQVGTPGGSSTHPTMEIPGMQGQ